MICVVAATCTCLVVKLMYVCWKVEKAGYRLGSSKFLNRDLVDKKHPYVSFYTVDENHLF